jgi:Flp pilus assembly protein protease CpaA
MIEWVMYQTKLLILLTSCFLGIGSIQDLKFRYVSDRIWIIQSCLGILFTAWLLLSLPFLVSLFYILLLLQNFICSVFVGVVLYKTNSWGGADSKCMVAIALSSPLTFMWKESPIITNYLPPVIFILFNLIVILIGYNLVLLLRKSWKGFTNDNIFSMDLVHHHVSINYYDLFEEKSVKVFLPGIVFILLSYLCYVLYGSPLEFIISSILK